MWCAAKRRFYSPLCVLWMLLHIQVAILTSNHPTLGSPIYIYTHVYIYMSTRVIYIYHSGIWEYMRRYVRYVIYLCRYVRWYLRYVHICDICAGMCPVRRYFVEPHCTSYKYTCLWQSTPTPPQCITLHHQEAISPPPPTIPHTHSHCACSSFRR